MDVFSWIFRGFVKWVIGFSNPMIQIEIFLLFVLEFIIQASLGCLHKTKNEVIYSIRLPLLAHPLCFLTGVFLIQLWGSHKGFPSFLKISAKTAGNPWGLCLAECLSCCSHNYLKAHHLQNNSSIDVVCRGCSSTGSVKPPINWDIRIFSVDNNQQF